jgi:hypothetical protein
MPGTSKNRTMKRKSSNYKRKTAKRKTAKKSSYKPSASFSKQMKKYNNINNEKKIMLMNNYLNSSGIGYLQDLPAVALPNAGIDNKALTCVVLQTGRQYTDTNLDISNCVSLMDGYSNTNGVLPGHLIGQYAKITSSYMNINITMDPLSIASDTDGELLDAATPHQFRLIQVKARRDKMVNPALQVSGVGVPSIATNLFRNEEGSSRGINSECATQDIFTWFINKQFWTVLKDERFTLATPLTSYNNSAPLAIGAGLTQHKNARFKRYWLPKPSNKVIFRANTVDGVQRNEIVDYNYVVHTIILCKNTSAGERPSDHWSVQANGATAFMDE